MAEIQEGILDEPVDVQQIAELMKTELKLDEQNAFKVKEEGEDSDKEDEEKKAKVSGDGEDRRKRLFQLMSQHRLNEPKTEENAVVVDDPTVLSFERNRPMEIQLGELTEHEKKEFEKLKLLWTSKERPFQATDSDYLKFLRARKFVANAAYATMKNYYDWALAVGIDKLNIRAVREQLEQNILYLPGSVDREGCTTVFMIPHLYYPSKVPVEVILRAFLYLMERVIESEKNQIQGFTFMATMKGWGWSNYGTHYARTWFDTLQNRYPARIRKFVICDSPGWFGAVWGMIRPMMSAKFASKFYLPRTKADTDKIIDLKQVPVEIGGELQVDQQAFIKKRYEAEGFTYGAVDEGEPVQLPNVTGHAIQRQTRSQTIIQIEKKLKDEETNGKEEQTE